MELFVTAAHRDEQFHSFLRALREICGLTIAQVASELDVGGEVVRLWESGKAEVPESALAWMRGMAVEHSLQARRDIEEVTARARPGQAVAMNHYRDQIQADLAAELAGIEPISHRLLNAVTRSTAERLIEMGYPVSCIYPDEERSDVKRG